jgi:hypothetical protein
MTLELEQAIKKAKEGNLQEAVLLLCEAVQQLQSKLNYLEVTKQD